MNNFDLDFDSKVHVKKYSVGMRQKMGITQSVMEDQNLILLDEPTRGLDKKITRAVSSIGPTAS